MSAGVSTSRMRDRPRAATALAPALFTIGLAAAASVPVSVPAGTMARAAFAASSVWADRRSTSACRASRTAAARPVASGPSSINTTSLTGSDDLISSGIPPPRTANIGKASSDSQKPTVRA